MDVQWVASQFPALSNLKLLATGGQKTVFSATHPLEGSVVLKLLLKDSNEDRLQREILACELLDCPRVPRIYETSTLVTPVGPYVWLREQRVIGMTLREALEHGPLGLDKLMKLCEQILEALKVAESKRIVHRDIKPENVMVDTSGDYWLLDFGISRHLDMESLTATQSYYGVFTPGYAAPEQMMNQKLQIDSRADLFALGVLMYECATGSNPFVVGVDGVLEILSRVENLQLPPLHLPYDSGRVLDGFISTLTQKYPSRRPMSVLKSAEWFEEVKQSLLI